MQEGAFSAKQIGTLQALIDGKDDLLGEQQTH